MFDLTLRIIEITKKWKIKTSLCITVFDLFLFLQHNVMVFIAELFWWFEVVKPDFVKPRDLQEIKDG